MTTTFADLGVPAELVSTLKARGILAPFAIQTLTVADGCAGRDLCGRAPTGSGKTIAFGIPLAMRLSRVRRRNGRPASSSFPPASSRRRSAESSNGSAGSASSGSRRSTAAPDSARSSRHSAAASTCWSRARAGSPTSWSAARSASTRSRSSSSTKPTGWPTWVSSPLSSACSTPRRRPARRCCSRRRSTAPSTRSCVVTSATRCVTRCRRSSTDAPRATHLFWSVHPDKRVALCADVIKLAGPTIVFCKTKRGTDRIARRLEEAGVRTEAIHGNRSQSQRERALALFARGSVDALVATDVAARGIHVDNVACVVHFDLPNDAKDYMHRSGRTARAGEAGTVVSFVGSQQAREAAELQRGARNAPRSRATGSRRARVDHAGRGEPARSRDGRRHRGD